MIALPRCLGSTNRNDETNRENRMKKTASAHWSGGIQDGQGSISTQTGVLHDAPYGFKSRFEDGPGTNPEELLGAAHAGCYTMALSLGLGNAKLTADSIDTKAVVTLDKDGDGFSITAVHLTCKAKVPGADAETFAKIAQATKDGCPVSKVLKATITLDASLEA
jgi:osmotically inducible protein OsmC